jgi:hypothetical protein
MKTDHKYSSGMSAKYYSYAKNTDMCEERHSEVICPISNEDIIHIYAIIFSKNVGNNNNN